MMNIKYDNLTVSTSGKDLVDIAKYSNTLSSDEFDILIKRGLKFVGMLGITGLTTVGIYASYRYVKYFFDKKDLEVKEEDVTKIDKK